MVKEKIVGMVVMIILFSLMNVEGQLPVDEDVVLSLIHISEPTRPY